MQIYCYSIIQFVAAYFARTLIPYNAAVVSITAIAGNIEMVPNSGLKSRSRLRGRIIYYTPKYTLKLSAGQARCNEIYRDATKHARLELPCHPVPCHIARVLKVSRD